MHVKDVTARKVKKARIKQIKKITKNRLFISVVLLQLIHDFEVEWKTINEIWLVEQEKKDRKKKPRLEKSVNEKKDDDLECVINKFHNEDDFISFKNDNNEIANISHVRHSKHENFHTNFSINDEFNSRNFFDDINNEQAFQTLYS